MTNVIPEMCLRKAQELSQINPKFILLNGFVVTYTDWSHGHTLDFYAVKEVDPEEGRIEAAAVGCYQGESNRIIQRAPCNVIFWVISFNLKKQVYTVSFVHPEDKIKTDEILYGLAFNCPTGLAIAQIGCRDKKRKLKNKLQNKKNEGEEESLVN